MYFTNMDKHLRGAIFGLCVADAVGVPVEFKSRELLERDPVVGMRGYGTYNQPPGTWSDDSSMTLCLLDSLCGGLELNDIMSRFRSWLFDGKYTPHGAVFDIGNVTRQAITRSRDGIRPVDCGGKTEYDNGNGSLMRILPAAFHLAHLYGRNTTLTRKMMESVHQISALTHGHERSLMACGIYTSIAIELIGRNDLPYAISCGINKAAKYYKRSRRFSCELPHFDRLMNEGLELLPVSEIRSSGYVVDSLEAALWCLLHSSSYEECVLKAVNLGGDTDTIAAVAGGLAGIHYGYETIPELWLKKLVKRDVIATLCEKAATAMAINSAELILVHLPLLLEIESNNEYLEWCIDHSAYEEDRPCGTLADQISIFFEAFYFSGISVANYSEVLTSYEWCQDDTAQVPLEKLHEADMLLTRAMLTWHFRRDRFNEGALINDSIANGNLRQILSHMAELCETERKRLSRSWDDSSKSVRSNDM